MKSDTFKYSLLFGIIYFVQGTGTPSSGIAGQPILYLLKEVMRLSASQSAYFLALMGMAWNIKPVYGILSDFFPLLGYRRKSYLVLVNVLALSSWITLSSMNSYNYYSILVILMTCSMGFAFSDVLCDALMVEKGQPLNMTGRFQAIQWAFISLASVISGIGGGYVAEHLSYQSIFLTASFFPLLTVIGTFIVVGEEKKEVDRGKIWANLSIIKEILRWKTFWVVISFIFLWNFSPSFGTPLLYYMRDELGFSKIFIGTLEAIGSGAGIIGSLIFWKYCRKLSIKKLLNISVAIGTISISSYLGLVGIKSAILLYFLVGAIFMIAHLTVLDLAARSCPKGIEGTVFALLMSVFNIGSMGSRFLGGWLYDVVGLNPLIMISALFTAGCWLIIPLLKESSMCQR